MKIEQIFTFTDEDIKLLKKELPNDPCYKCDAKIRGYCCGCSVGTDYNKAVKQYRDNNIYDLALKIKEFNDLDKSIKEMCKRQVDILDNLPIQVGSILSDKK